MNAVEKLSAAWPDDIVLNDDNDTGRPLLVVDIGNAFAKHYAEATK